MQCGGRRQRERAEEKRGAEGTEEALFRTQDRTRKLRRRRVDETPGEEHAHGLQRQSRDGESPPGQRNVRNDMARDVRRRCKEAASLLPPEILHLDLVAKL